MDSKETIRLEVTAQVELWCRRKGAGASEKARQNHHVVLEEARSLAAKGPKEMGSRLEEESGNPEEARRRLAFSARDFLVIQELVDQAEEAQALARKACEQAADAMASATAWMDEVARQLKWMTEPALAEGAAPRAIVLPHAKTREWGRHARLVQTTTGFRGVFLVKPELEPLLGPDVAACSAKLADAFKALETNRTYQAMAHQAEMTVSAAVATLEARMKALSRAAQAAWGQDVPPVFLLPGMAAAAGGQSGSVRKKRGGKKVGGGGVGNAREEPRDSDPGSHQGGPGPTE